MAAAALTTILSSSSSPPTSPRPRARARARINLRKPRHHLLLPGAAALGALLANGGAAIAAPLSYEETLRLSTDSGGGGGGEFALPDLGIGGVIDFVTENPIVAAASVAAVALPVILARVLGGGGGSKPYGVVSAAAAYRTLVEEPGAQLVDIRAPGEARETGSPDLREARKKAAAVPYDGEDKNGFLKRISLRFKDPENTTLVILDKFDGNSELVAELLTANGYKAAFAVKDGAEGRRGWLKSDLPWAAPSKGFSLSGLIGDGTDGLPVTLGLAAATGLGILAYTEIETVLQFLGSAAIVQLVASKLIYAEDRKKTLKQIDDFFNKKVAPKELVDEIKEIGQALLPSTGTKSQPATIEAAPAAATATAAPPAAPAEATTEAPPAAPAEATTEAPPAEPTPLSPYPNYPDLKPPSSPSPLAPAEAAKNESKAESPATESAAAANSAPVSEATTEAPPAAPRPLSPYPNYPDLKPPSSPSPSAP